MKVVQSSFRQSLCSISAQAFIVVGGEWLIHRTIKTHQTVR
jgi:hypothetical protein